MSAPVTPRRTRRENGKPAREHKPATPRPTAKPKLPSPASWREHREKRYK